jgi:phage/plasmid primase-like uncharacterized protein
MSDNQVSTLAFRLLADLTAAGSAARFAVRAISAAHFPAPHALFKESSALCDETTELALTLLRGTGDYASLSLVELASATPALRIFSPTNPGDVATALRSAHGDIAEMLAAIRDLVDISNFGAVSAAAIRHTELASALAGAQEVPTIAGA